LPFTAIDKAATALQATPLQRVYWLPYCYTLRWPLRQLTEVIIIADIEALSDAVRHYLRHIIE